MISNTIVVIYPKNRCYSISENVKDHEGIKIGIPLFVLKENLNTPLSILLCGGRIFLLQEQTQ